MLYRILYTHRITRSERQKARKEMCQQLLGLYPVVPAVRLGHVFRLVPAMLSGMVHPLPAGAKVGACDRLELLVAFSGAADFCGAVSWCGCERLELQTASLEDCGDLRS